MRYETDSEPMAIASGWILKIKDTFTNMKIDLTVNKTCELLNSSLIMEYSKLDSRLLKLSYVLKKWNHNPNSVHNKFNQYSVILMLIAFMQSKKMIPNLQARPLLFNKLIIN